MRLFIILKYCFFELQPVGYWWLGFKMSFQSTTKFAKIARETIMPCIKELKCHL